MIFDILNNPPRSPEDIGVKTDAEEAIRESLNGVAEARRGMHARNWGRSAGAELKGAIVPFDRELATEIIGQMATEFGSEAAFFRSGFEDTVSQPEQAQAVGIA